MQPVNQRFRDLTLGAFLDRVASSEPVPGGGSAAALAGSLGAGLVAMVASLSERRARYEDYAELHERAHAVGLRLVDRFLQLADDDAAAYGRFAAALKMPKGSPEEVHERGSAMRAAAREAAEVPLRCVEACLELAEAAEALAGRSNANAASDLNVASLLAEAAARGAGANVLVNLPSVGDPELADRLTVRVEELLREVGRLGDETRQVVLSGQTREPLELASTGRG